MQYDFSWIFLILKKKILIVTTCLIEVCAYTQVHLCVYTVFVCLAFSIMSFSPKNPTTVNLL